MVIVWIWFFFGFVGAVLTTVSNLLVDWEAEGLVQITLVDVIIFVLLLFLGPAGLLWAIQEIDTDLFLKLTNMLDKVVLFQRSKK